MLTTQAFLFSTNPTDMVTIKRVILDKDDSVSIAQVTSKKVYFFKEQHEWFYLTGDMRRFRNLEQTNGWSGGAKAFKTEVKQTMIAVDPPREMFEACDMYEFIDYIREQDQPESL